MNRLLLAFCSLALAAEVAVAAAQSNALPMVGAQVFIEPGQSPEYIDSLFTVMEANGMKVGRIRMFGTHMLRNDGSWDFSLYDEAFKSAARHGVQLFATLFPVTDELSDVGGFKFPGSLSHLEEVDRYIQAVVGHFKDNSALLCWVLQNEPGTGGTVSYRSTELSRKVYEEYLRSNPQPERNGFLAESFTPEKFTRYYTAWYLGHISDLVARIDPLHGRHINPHQLLQTYPEYDFKSFEKFLTSLGVSMHFSWHFSEFERNEYPLGVAFMSDIVSQASGSNPWWITEMQGGMVTASGYKVLCPTAKEIEQSVWTGLMSGAKGVIFWTLNQRRAVQESGEWGLLDYQLGNSERVDAIKTVNEQLSSDSEFYISASPVKSRIAVLFNAQSQWVQSRNASISRDDIEGRSRTAVIKSMIAAYKALSERGLSPKVVDMDLCNWDEFDTALLPDCIALTSEQIDSLKKFVRNGGKLIITGLTGYYDETMGCRFMGESSLYELLGGRIKEIEIQEEAGSVNFKGLKLPNHIWSGLIAKEDGTISLFNENEYGKGSVTWLPSMIDIGCRKDDLRKLSSFYCKILKNELSNEPVRFASYEKDVYMRVLSDGEEYKAIVVNKSARAKIIRIKGSIRKTLIIRANSCVIL